MPPLDTQYSTSTSFDKVKFYLALKRSRNQCVGVGADLGGGNFRLRRGVQDLTAEGFANLYNFSLLKAVNLSGDMQSFHY